MRKEALMKGAKVIVLAVLVLFCVAGVVMATDASVEKGKALFGDAALGTSGKTCSGCHPDGKGMAAAAGKMKWTLQGTDYSSLEDVVNACVTGPLKGKALAKDSVEMKSLIMYIKSFAGKAEKKKEVQFGC